MWPALLACRRYLANPESASGSASPCIFLFKTEGAWQFCSEPSHLPTRSDVRTLAVPLTGSRVALDGCEQFQYLSFLAGERLGAIELTPTAPALVALAFAWALAMPLLMRLAVRLDGVSSGPIPSFVRQDWRVSNHV